MVFEPELKKVELHSPKPDDYLDDEHEWTQEEIDAYYTYVEDEPGSEGSEAFYDEGWY